MPGPTPLDEVRRRLPQAGRIRLGVKGGPQGRHAIDTFRFTSQRRDGLDAVAKLHGGTVKPWSEPKSPDRFELLTDVDQIKVILPPNPLTEWYEMWSGKHGLIRRCDARTCDLQVQGPEGPDRQEVPCICVETGILECDYKLRLSVLLPEAKGLGTWRLDTSSVNSKEKIPGVVELIEAVQHQGLHWAVLRIEHGTAPGRRFSYPVLDIDHTMQELVDGATRMAALPETPLAVGPGYNDGAPDKAYIGFRDDVIDVVSDPITGELPIDPSIGQAWIDALTRTQCNRVLTRAVEIALAEGEPAPNRIEDLSPKMIDRLMQEALG